MMTFQLFLLIALSFKLKVASTYSLPSNKEYLDTTNLIDVHKALQDHNFNENNWRALCLYLGLYVNRLDIIEENHHSVDRCLQECLKFWLSQADGAKSPTWFSLIVAMRDIGEITTANGIDREKHPACEILDRYTSDPTVQRNLLGLSYLLHSENIISKRIWSSGEKLLKDVKKTICQNDQHLKTFADILQRSDRTEKVGKAIMNEYKEYKEECTNEDYKITAEKGIHLDIVNFTKVRMVYAATFDAIDKVIASDTPSLAELQTFLRRGYGYCKLPSQCESIKDIFDMIADECTLINIGLLESVVDSWNNEEAKQIIEQYNKYISDFNQMKLHRFLDAKFFDGSLLQSETALFYVDRSIKNSTLEDVRLLLATAFTKLDQYVKVVVIREGNSYIITCSFPLHLSMELILSATENIEELKKKGLQRLTIGFSTVYDKVKDEVCEQEMQMTQMGFMTMGESHCPSDNSYGMLEQMAIYMSVNQLNEASYKEDTEIGIKSNDSGPSSWLLILLLLCIITIYIFTSCQPHEEATLLTYSRKGIRYSEEDKGVLIKYDEEIKMELAQKGQNPMHVDFRHIHCYKMPGDQCELDSTCTWEDRLGKKRDQIVFLVDNKHDKFPSWYYLLIFEDALNEFKDKQDRGNIGVKEAKKYGKVLYSGPGQNPPSDVKKKLNLRFDMNTYASYKFTDC
ncbi:PREDICTED: uncharacterized protein LOC109588841 [Amphimedon queenslandica]|uniref:Death domain-containing protein n=1 Tax=Amphimedon queenslandica TaxID=400682 RepID=A0AAN0JUE3_AMPQE|nr:PREDICTED: uncharacterized protein LOC109588841 [Amphimedon queenslandica]|eukprot:XP_019860511.1 PREDICTED: uncharacterized protein LOC109588841 [Amphimedon queenslandica]